MKLNNILSLLRYLIDYSTSCFRYLNQSHNCQLISAIYSINKP